MVQIGELAFKSRWDGRELSRGLLTTRAQTAAAKKMLEESRTPLEKYKVGLENLANMSARFSHVAEKQVELSAKLEKGYLEEESAIRRLTKAERARLELLQLPDAIRSRQKSPAQMREERDAANRTRGQQVQQNRQRQFSAIDDSERIGRAALAERLARFRQSGMTDSQARSRRGKSWNDDAVFAAQEFGRFESTYSARNAGSNRRRHRTMEPLAGDPEAGSQPGGISAIGFGAKAFIGGMAVNKVLQTAAAMKDFVSASSDAYVEIEKLTTQFEVFTGSKTKATGLINQLRELSSVAGISVTALAQGASTLLSYGMSTEDASMKLKELATISRGDSERFKMMALALGQVQAAGRLMGQETLQLINAGFNPLAEISRTTGRSMLDLKKDMEAGLITVDMVMKAFQSATSAGGMYNGMLEKLGETTQGALSKSNAAWDQAKTAIGELFAPITRLKAELSTKLAQDIRNVAEAFTPENGQIGLDKLQPAMDAAVKSTFGVDEARKRRNAEAIAAQKAQQDAAFKAEEDRQAAMKAAGLDSLSGMTASMLQGSVDEEDFKKFSRALSLMDDVDRKRATEDFATYKNLDGVYSYLDKEVQMRLRDLDAMELQNAEREKAKKLEAELAAKGKDLMDRNKSPSERLKENLSQIEQMLASNSISPEVADRERFAAGQQYGQDVASQKKAETEIGIANAKATGEEIQKKLDETTSRRMALESQLSSDPRKRRMQLNENPDMERSIKYMMRQESALQNQLGANDQQMGQLVAASMAAAGIRPSATASTLQSGSAEAYKYLAELESPVNKVQDDQLTELQKMNEVQKQLLAIQKENKEAIKKMAESRPVRARA